MNKIVLILAYFGNTPSYFRFWRKSAEMNSTIDFLLYTDMELSDSSNIRIKKMSFNQFKMRINSMFPFKCWLESPYKICDYRPAFGYVFQEDLTDYEYWGYVDSDVIFGNLENFLTPERLENYERVSNLGHLTVFRNIDVVNRKFMLEKCGMYFTYKEAFSLKQNVAFDEKGGMKWLSDIGYIRTYTDYKFVADIFPDTFHFRTFYNYESDQKHIYRYNKGILTALYSNEENDEVNEVEMMYIHLQARKMKIETDSLDNYLILPDRFTNDCSVNAKDIRKYNQGELKDVVSFKEIPKIEMPFLFKLKKYLRRRVFMNRKFSV